MPVTTSPIPAGSAASVGPKHKEYTPRDAIDLSRHEAVARAPGRARIPIKNGYQLESLMSERHPCFLSMRLPYTSCVCML